MNDVSRADPPTRARELAPTINAAADETERIRRIPEPLLDELHTARLFRMLYPRSVGGDEVEPATYIEAVGELARADSSVGWCVSIANSIGLFAPYLDLEAAHTVFGDERATAPRQAATTACARGPVHRPARRGAGSGSADTNRSPSPVTSQAGRRSVLASCTWPATG